MQAAFIALCHIWLASVHRTLGGALPLHVFLESPPSLSKLVTALDFYSD